MLLKNVLDELLFTLNVQLSNINSKYRHAYILYMRYTIFAVLNSFNQLIDMISIKRCKNAAN